MLSRLNKRVESEAGVAVGEDAGVGVGVVRVIDGVGVGEETGRDLAGSARMIQICRPIMTIKKTVIIGQQDNFIQPPFMSSKVILLYPASHLSNPGEFS